MSPRTEEQNRRVREESRARILEAALELFARDGYEATPVREIARAAGVSQGLMYNYFAGKDDLLRALFEESMRDVRASFALAEGAADPVEALVGGAFTVVRANLRFWRLSYGVRMQPSVLAGLGEGVRAWTEEILATLERFLREGGAPEPRTEAAVLFALIDGVSQHYAMDPERYPLDAVEARIVAHYRRLAADRTSSS